MQIANREGKVWCSALGQHAFESSLLIWNAPLEKRLDLGLSFLI